MTTAVTTQAPPAAHPELAEMTVPVEEATRADKARYVLALVRLALGWIFLWAFADKLFGLGFATERADAWINGGSPTFGYLNFATEGKYFHEFFAGLSGPVADWLFMAGLAGIGLALILGIAMRLAAASGVVMLVAMWAAGLPLENNPFVDDHLVYAMVLVALAVYGAGRTWGLGRAWDKLAIVQRLPILR